MIAHVYHHKHHLTKYVDGVDEVESANTRKTAIAFVAAVRATWVLGKASCIISDFPRDFVARESEHLDHGNLSLRTRLASGYNSCRDEVHTDHQPRDLAAESAMVWTANQENWDHSWIQTSREIVPTRIL